jgi:phthalate 4,5-dioxygenase oxygenase subunit
MIPVTKVLRDFARPEIRIDHQTYGFSLSTIRRIDDERTHVRITNLLFPNAICVPMSEEMTLTQWHVPIDDVTSYWYTIFTSYGNPVDQAFMRAQRLELYTLPDYKPRVGKANAYGFDADEQRTSTYTGMGDDINVHDQWAVESQGAIQDRTREHLGQSDKGITAYRKLLFAELKAPSAPPDVQRVGPGTIDGLGPSDQWEAHWLAAIDARSNAAAWHAEATASAKIGVH